MLATSVSAWASGLQPLTLGSLSHLNARSEGQRHAQIFWSLTCVPCRRELADLGRIKDVGKLPISLINTDPLNQAEAVEAFLAKQKLEGMDNWQFADAIPDRLREAIDPDWYGELPRSYVIKVDGGRRGYSGIIEVARLASWLTARGNVAHTPPAVP
jgi:hypothetical protein